MVQGMKLVGKQQDVAFICRLAWRLQQMTLGSSSVQKRHWSIQRMKMALTFCPSWTAQLLNERVPGQPTTRCVAEMTPCTGI